MGTNLKRLLTDLDDREVALAVRDLGGHDLADLVSAFNEADHEADRPSVVFAYTIKAWSLPTQGHPANHSALLTPDQWRQLATELGADADDPWALFPNASAEAELCRETRGGCSGQRSPRRSSDVPVELGRPHASLGSTQQALGRFFVDLTHTAPETAARML